MVTRKRLCLRGYTQNTNEALNNLIWKYVPKKKNHGIVTVNTAVSLAVGMFNDGAVTLAQATVQLLFLTTDMARETKAIKMEQVARKEKFNAPETEVEPLHRQKDSRCRAGLRYALYCFNICILFLGLAVLGMGLWMLLTDLSAPSLTTIVGSNLYETTAYLFIFGGIALALFAICGCYGAFRKNKPVLILYISLLAVVLCVLIGTCGMTISFKGKVSETYMKDMLSLKYGIDIRTNPENLHVTESWDGMQRQLQCCGVSGNVTSRYSWSYYSASTQWGRRQHIQSDRKRVPESCCSPGDMQLCTGLKDFNGPPMFFNSHLSRYQATNPYLYTTGCHGKLVEYLDTPIIVSATAAFLLLFFIAGFVVAFCLGARAWG